MKKLLCYVGIIVLLGLVLFPPILRITLPDKKKVKKQEVITSNILSCQNDLFVIKSRYENKKVKMIVIKKMLLNEEDSNISNKSSNLIKIFDKLKENNNVVINSLDDGDVILIDFSVSEPKTFNINYLTQDLDEQKLYYENEQLVCSIG